MRQELLSYTALLNIESEGAEHIERFETYEKTLGILNLVI